MKKFLIFIASFVLLIAAFIWGATWFLAVDNLADCPQKPTANGSCQTTDAIVAISGGDTNARLNQTVWLYKNGWAPKMIVSGAAKDRNSPSNAHAMAERAKSMGVPVEAIITEESSVDTAANAIRVAAIVQKNGFSRLILVTSQYHQRRASMEFARALPSGVTVLNHPTPDDTFWDRRSWWTTLGGWELTLNELGKIIYISAMERT